MNETIIHPLLSHQPKEEFYKCFPINLFEKKVYFCSRCFGYLIAFFPLLLLQILINFNATQTLSIIILYFFPFVTFYDWALTKLKFIKSNNANRIIGGVFLAISAAHAIFLFLKTPYNLNLYFAAAIYALMTLIIKKLENAQWQKRN